MLVCVRVAGVGGVPLPLLQQANFGDAQWQLAHQAHLPPMNVMQVTPSPAMAQLQAQCQFGESMLRPFNTIHPPPFSSQQLAAQEARLAESVHFAARAQATYNNILTSTPSVATVPNITVEMASSKGQPVLSKRASKDNEGDKSTSKGKKTKKATTKQAAPIAKKSAPTVTQGTPDDVTGTGGSANSGERDAAGEGAGDEGGEEVLTNVAPMPQHTTDPVKNPLYRVAREAHLDEGTNKTLRPPTPKFYETTDRVNAANGLRQGSFVAYGGGGEAMPTYLPIISSKERKPLYDTSHPVTPLSITIELNGRHVPREWLQLVDDFIITFSLSGVAALEVGDKEKLLHLQCVMTVNMPGTKQAVDTMTDHMRVWFDMWTNDKGVMGIKICQAAREHSYMAMVGYVMKVGTVHCLFLSENMHFNSQ
jgi:hypothetical protein